jgi:hypothetical protein
MTIGLSPIDTRVFPVDYASARQRWLTALNAVSAIRHNYPCAGSGPQGEDLFTDCAWIGSPDANSVVVILAATHGVEGFVGSAVQIDLLNNLVGNAVADNTALLLIHGLTPWGYAWSRRCDADGVDLNRNYVNFAQPLPQNPDYDRLRPAMFETDATQRWLLFEDFARHYGRVALEQAISGGQYTDPLGPFFGGRASAHGRLVCEDLIARFDLRRRRLAVIDLHSGLGPYGYGEIICDHAPDSSGAATAQHWYGDAVTLPLAGTSHSVPKLGLLDYLWHAIMGEDSCYITLEFGSYSTERLFEVILQDHLLWAQPATEALRIEHGEQMRRHFCPQDPAWRELVLFRARQVIRQAIEGIRT